MGRETYPSDQKVVKSREEESWTDFSKCAVQIKFITKTQLSRTKPDPDQAKAGPNQSTDHMSITNVTPKPLLSVFMRILLGLHIRSNPNRNKQEMYMIFLHVFPRNYVRCSSHWRPPYVYVYVIYIHRRERETRQHNVYIVYDVNNVHNVYIVHKVYNL